MKAQEIKELSQDELINKEAELKEEIFNLRLQIATQQTTNVARIRNLKRDLARVLTIKKKRVLIEGVVWTMPRGKYQSRVGTVISDKMEKSVIVDVMQIKTHKRYKKSIKRNTKFIAHDESGQCKIGDKVLILEARPYSKSKRWKVSKILEPGSPLEAEIAEQQ